jgi:hypothetical protein
MCGVIAIVSKCAKDWERSSWNCNLKDTSWHAQGTPPKALAGTLAAYAHTHVTSQQWRIIVIIKEHILQFLQLFCTFRHSVSKSHKTLQPLNCFPVNSSIASFSGENYPQVQPSFLHLQMPTMASPWGSLWRLLPMLLPFLPWMDQEPPQATTPGYDPISDPILTDLLVTLICAWVDGSSNPIQCHQPHMNPHWHPSFSLNIRLVLLMFS